MSTAPLLTIKGEEKEKVTLAKQMFGEKAPVQVMAQAVRVYLANQRKAKPKTKTRGEVAKTTAKMYKQKGTGRARHGAYSAPIFVGGGVALGPTGNQNWKMKMPKKMAELAFRGALTEKAEEKNVAVVSGAGKATGKTKQVNDLVTKLAEKKGQLLVVTASDQKGFIKAVRNIAGVSVSQAERLNTYDILKAKKLVFTEEAIAQMLKIHAN